MPVLKRLTFNNHIKASQQSGKHKDTVKIDPEERNVSVHERNEEAT